MKDIFKIIIVPEIQLVMFGADRSDTNILDFLLGDLIFQFKKIVLHINFNLILCAELTVDDKSVAGLRGLGLSYMPTVYIIKSIIL